MRIWKMTLLAGVFAVSVGGCAATKTAADNTSEFATDSWITAQIKSQYGVSKQVKAGNINADTNDGVVTLRGVVDSADEAEAAVRMALETKGVRAVKSELRYPTGEQRARTYYPGEPVRF